MTNEFRAPVISKSVGYPYYVTDDWQNQNNLATFEADISIPLVINQSQHFLWNNFTNVSRYVLDDWHVPPVLQGLIQVFPIGQSTQEAVDLAGTRIDRAYDWLVIQYPMLTPVTPPFNPGNLTQGPVIPNYAFNAPSIYTSIGKLF